MRQSLLDLIDKTIIYQYDLPDKGKGILKTIFSTENDKCYIAQNIDDIAEIIYNSIVEYSFNEFELNENDYQSLHAEALATKIRYNPDDDDDVKLKYGFFGEVLLYCLLSVHFKAKPLIARGYFYNPLENAESKGFDSYLLVENNSKTELWFGEVKFHKSYSQAIKSVLENIDKAISEDYLKKNFLALHTRKNDFNITGSQVETILNAWKKNPTGINLIEEIKKYDIKLVYPILLLYQQDTKGYDNNIKKVIQHIQDTYTAKTFNLSVKYSIFFILMPLEKVKEIKTSVIAWIKSKKQLMS